MKTEPIYMTVKSVGKSWSETEQTYLGNIDWNIAVNIAKSQKSEVRLTNCSGYGGQGYYFTPNNYVPKFCTYEKHCECENCGVYTLKGNCDFQSIEPK